MKAPGHKIFLLGFLVLLGVSACAPSRSSRKTASADFTSAPGWVRQRPMDGAYYIGIASVAKREGYDNYRVAKQLALEDMASEISVEVKSTTTHYVSETNRSYFEEQWQSLVKTKSLEHLREYEPVDSWDSETHLWVYYRLSRADYKAWREREKRNALANASQWMTQAEQAILDGYPHQAFSFLAKAREALLPFPDAIDGSTSLQGVDAKAIALAGTLRFRAEALDNGPRWPGDPTEVLIKVLYISEGKELPASGLKIAVRDPLGDKRYSVPTNGEIRINETARQIEIRYDFGEYVHSLPVLVNLRKSEQVIIPANNTAIYLKPGADKYESILSPEVARAIERAGFTLTTNPAEAEWVGTLQVDWRQTEQYGMYTVWCRPSLVLNHRSHKSYMRQWDLNEAKGTHTSRTEAKRLAATEARHRIKYQTYSGTPQLQDYSRGN